MGLDMAFYDENKTELISLRNHHEFFLLFEPVHSDMLHPYSDFLVSQWMLGEVLEKIEFEMADCGMPIHPLSAQPEGEEESDLGMPDGFVGSEPVDWVAALPMYRVLIVRLIDRAKEGDLICGWSC